MGKWVYRKPEPCHVKGTCVICLHRKQESVGKGRYRPLCTQCRKSRHGVSTGIYRKHKKDKCCKCGFIPEHFCQLDVDHIDGDNSNHDINNLQTLCANCHRLKTFNQLHGE